MKKAAVLLIAVIITVFGGCTVFQISEETTSENSGDVNTTAIIVSIPGATEGLSAEESASGISEESTTDAQTSVVPEETSSEQLTVREEKTTKEEKTTREEKTTKEEKPTKEEKTTAKIPEEVELSISMPEKNGTMVTDDSSDNKYIKIVNKEKKIDSSLLLAVYSVPESGQNYVFEFFDAEDFDADNIRRVYLIDAYGDITSVAATESSERVNLSPVENWFCMNVLIKEIIYPALSEQG